MVSFILEMVESILVCFFELLLEGFQMRKLIVKFMVLLLEQLIFFDELIEKLISFVVHARVLGLFSVSGVDIAGIR